MQTYRNVTYWVSECYYGQKRRNFQKFWKLPQSPLTRKNSIDFWNLFSHAILAKPKAICHITILEDLNHNEESHVTRSIHLVFSAWQRYICEWISRKKLRLQVSKIHCEKLVSVKKPECSLCGSKMMK